MDSSWITGDPIGIYLQLSEQIKGSGAIFFYQLAAGLGTVVNSGSSTYRALDAGVKLPTR
jgi:hypothetical protein